MKRIYLVLLLPCLLATLASCGRHHNNISFDRAVDELNDTSLLNILIDSARVCLSKSRYAETLAYAREAVQMSSSIGDTIALADALSYELVPYQKMGLWDSSIVVASKLLALDEAIGDKEMLSYDYNSLACIYYEGKDLEKAREFIDKAIALEKQTDTQDKLSVRYGTACEIFNQMGQHDTALDYAQKALYLDSVAGNALGIARRKAQAADVYTLMNKLTEAELYSLSAYAILDSIGERHSLALTCKTLGNILLRDNRQQEAIIWLEKAIAFGKEIGELRLQTDAYQSLSQAYSTVDPQRELACLKQYTLLHDSLVNADKMRALTEFVVRYDSQSKDIRLQQQSEALSSWRGYVGWLVALVVALVALVAGWQIVARRREQRLAEQVLQLERNIEELKQQFLERANKTQPETDNEANKLTAEDHQFLAKVNQYILEQMDKADLSVESIASRLCITSQQLRRKLTALTGQSGAAYITNFRLEFAKNLLLQDLQLSINEVALRCGFEESGNFSRAFKNKVGLSPLQFRKRGILE